MGLGEGQSPTLEACFNLLLPGTFLTHLLDAINRAFNKPPLRLVTPTELQTFFNVLLILHVHRCSPEMLFAELRDEVPGEGIFCSSKLRAVWIKNDAENAFKRCLRGISYMCNKEERKSSWQETQTFDGVIHVAAECT